MEASSYDSIDIYRFSIPIRHSQFEISQSFIAITSIPKGLDLIYHAFRIAIFEEKRIIREIKGLLL